MRASASFGVEPLPRASPVEWVAAFEAPALFQLRSVRRAVRRLVRNGGERIGMRSAHLIFPVQTEGRGGIFRRSQALQLASGPPAIGSLFVEDALGHYAFVDDESACSIVDRLYGLPGAKFGFAFFSYRCLDGSRLAVVSLEIS